MTSDNQAWQGTGNLPAVEIGMIVVPIMRRARAQHGDDVSFDAESPEFRRIAGRSLTDPEYLYGPSFLVVELATGRRLELFFGGAGRAEAKQVYPLLPLTQAMIDEWELIGIEPHEPIPFRLTADGKVEPVDSPDHSPAAAMAAA